MSKSLHRGPKGGGVQTPWTPASAHDIHHHCFGVLFARYFYDCWLSNDSIEALFISYTICWLLFFRSADRSMLFERIQYIRDLSYVTPKHQNYIRFN